MKKDLKISGEEYYYDTYSLPNGLPDTFIPEIGKWIGVGKGGSVYPLDHTAVLPETDPGNPGTRPDFIGLYGMVVDVEYEQIGGKTLDSVSNVRCGNTTGSKMILGQDVVVPLMNTIHGGAALKVITSGADIGKLDIATSGETYNAIVETVNVDDGWLTIRLTYSLVLA